MKRFVSVYPPAFSDTYVKATSFSTYADFTKPYYATNYSTLLTGSYENQSWLSNTANPTNQRFHLDLGTATVINRIYYENWHNSGLASVTLGCKNFTLWGSNSATAFAELTYAIDTDWTQLTTDISQMVQHITSDISDPNFIQATNSTAYRYYAFKFADNWGDTSRMGLRRIELQQEVDVPEISASSIQGVSEIHL